MKNFIFLCVIAIPLSLTVSHKAFAQASEESQRRFEAEIETIDMSDMKSETHTAEQEALGEERNVASQKRTLQQLKAEKAHVEKTAKTRIAIAQRRRQRALKEQAVYGAEIKHLERQIDGIKGAVGLHESQADEAENLAASEESEVDALKEERSHLKKPLKRAKRVDAYNDMDVEAW